MNDPHPTGGVPLWRNRAERRAHRMYRGFTAKRIP